MIKSLVPITFIQTIQFYYINLSSFKIQGKHIKDILLIYLFM